MSQQDINWTGVFDGFQGRKGQPEGDMQRNFEGEILGYSQAEILKKAGLMSGEGCVAVSVKTGASAAGDVIFYNTKGFASEFRTERELADDEDWTTYVWSEPKYQAALATQTVRPKPMMRQSQSANQENEHVIMERATPEVRNAMRNMIRQEMDGLKKVMNNHQRRNESDREVKMKEFYREKYRCRYTPLSVNNGQIIGPNYSREKTTAMYSPANTPNTEPRATRKLSMSGLGPQTPAPTSNGAQTPGQASKGAQTPDKAAKDEQTPKSAKKKKAGLANSKEQWTYQYANDHKTRGPPYARNQR